MNDNFLSNLNPNETFHVFEEQNSFDNNNEFHTFNYEQVKQESEIINFYKDKSILITGASGFMGKVLLEKLLSTCSGIKKIYILLRDKKGWNAKQRLEQLLNAVIFDQLKQMQPDCFQKLIPVQGDISLPNLGISEEQINLILQEVSIVFHSAATVRFDEPLKDSVNFNLIGTRRIILLCRRIRNLHALVHVSTAYANCIREVIEEKFYEAPTDPIKLIDTLNYLDTDIVNQITHKIIGEWPNTYTFTKLLAEQLIYEESGRLPISIVRPSIVTCSANNPLKGWVDNLNGPTGLILATGKGMLRTMYNKSSAVADIIPVDYVINLMIAVAWNTVKNKQNEIPIYNCASGTLNPIKWGEIEKYVLKNLLKYPPTQVLRYPGGSFKNSKTVNEVFKFFEHTIPSYTLDLFSFLTGKKRVARRLYKKLDRAVNVLEYFTTRQWSFKANNVVALHEQLNSSDRKIFGFDVRKLEWEDYFEEYVKGARKFVLKESDDTLVLAKANLKKVYLTTLLTRFVFLFILVIILIKFIYFA